MTKLASAIQSLGDNTSLILIGPPGTGKTMVGSACSCPHALLDMKLE